MKCVFCGAAGPYTTKEHVVPESLGNDDLVLTDVVCDGCQNYFGKEIEAYVLQKTPFAFWRVWYGIRTKKHTLPSVDLSTPSRDKGRLPYITEHHDQGVGFTAHYDGSLSVDIDNPEIIRAILDGKKDKLQFALAPLPLSMIGRFLGKMGLELVASEHRKAAFGTGFDGIRNYVRKGVPRGLWPVLNGTLTHRLDVWEPSAATHLEECRTIYECSVYNVAGLWVFFFDIGWDRWGIVLNNQFPHPSMNESLASEKCKELRFVWYGDAQWRHSEPT